MKKSLWYSVTAALVTLSVVLMVARCGKSSSTDGSTVPANLNGMKF